MNSNFVTRALAPLFVALLAVIAAQERAAASSPLNGSWKGVYYTYPDIIVVELELQPEADGTATGRLKFFSGSPQRNALGTAKGAYPFTARFDEATQTFAFKPGIWIERPALGGAQVPIIGVFDAATHQLAGLFELPAAPNPQFFLAAPQPAGEQLVTSIMRSAYPSPAEERQVQEQTAQERITQSLSTLPPQMREKALAQMRERNQQRAAALEQLKQRAAGMPNGTGKAVLDALQQQMPPPTASAPASNWSAPSPEKIAQWAAQLKTEMPALDLRNTTFERLYRTARNLFADDSFQRYFGTTYDRMEVGHRRAVQNVFARNNAQLTEYQFLMRPFQPVGDFGAPDLTLSVFWQRSIRSWLKDSREIFGRLPAARDSFARMTQAEAIAGALTAFLWPREKSGFIGLLAETRARLAVPVLDAAAAQLMTSARDASGARQLATWPTRERELLDYAPPADRARLQQRVDAGLDELLEQLLAAELQTLSGSGRGLAAVEAGTRWYRNLSRAYDFALTRTPVQRALQRFQKARAASLGEASLSLVAKIDNAKSQAEMDSLLATYLGCPGDDATDVGRNLQKVAQQRIAYLREQEQLALYSNAERGIMDQPGHLNLAKLQGRTPWAPSPEEVRLALLRGFAFGSGKMINPHTAKMTSRLNGLLVPVTMIITVDALQIKRFAPDGDSYWVEYTANLKFGLPDHDAVWDADPNLRRGGQMAADMANASAHLLYEDPVVEQFRLYSDGWGVPRLREQGAATAGLDAMLNGLKSQHRPL